MNGAKVITAIVLIVTSLTASARTFEENIFAYVNKDFESSYSGFMELSLLGNVDAQLNIGVMHYRGEFVEKNIVEAYAWISLSVHNGNANAVKLHKIIEKKLSPEQILAASTRIAVLIENYSTASIEVMSMPSLDVTRQSRFQGATPKKSIVADYPKKMAMWGQGGWVDVQFDIDINGVVRNQTVLLSTNKEFEESALRALAETQYFPATFDDEPVSHFGKSRRYIYQMAGAIYDVEKVKAIVEPIKQKAALGSSYDMLVYARTIDLISSVTGDEEYNLDNSNTWYLKSAQYGSSTGKYFLGKNTLNGNQCSSDPEKGVFWLESAIKDNLIDAKYLLGMELIKGGRVKHDFNRGIELLKESADAKLLNGLVEYSKVLASHPDDNIRSPEKALEYFNMIPKREYLDKLSYYQLSAVIHANLGDFKTARKNQGRALKLIKRFELPDVKMKETLQSMKNQEKIIYTF